MAEHTSKQASALSSAERCLAILRALSVAEEDLQLQQIAAAVDLHPSTAHRLLATLVNRGFVEQQADRRYRLGLETFAVGSAFLRRSAVRRAAIPFVMKLAEQTRLTVNLGFWQSGRVIIVDCLPMPGMYRFYETGSAVPAHATALGKGLLAFRNRRELGGIGPLHRYTEKTICTVPALKEELGRILRQGYAVDDEECIPGGRCVAAPILEARKEPAAAISITGPATLIAGDRIAELGTLLRERCLNISVQLGYRPETMGPEITGDGQRGTTGDGAR